MRQALLLLLIAVSYSWANSELDPEQFNCSDVVYIRPDTGSKSWIGAQDVCREFNATLPLADTEEHRTCFFSALRNFGVNTKDVYAWMGAKSSGGRPNVWRWLDGSPYTGRAIPRGSYQQSYSYLSRDKTYGSIFYASLSTIKYSYICQYPASDNTSCNGTELGGSCFVTYNETATWFGARNKCLSNDGDLASFPNIATVDAVVERFSKSYWIGLRSSWWNWIDTVTGLTADLSFSRWADKQPGGTEPQCLSTIRSDNEEWRDFYCGEKQSFICQVSAQPSSSSSFETTTKRTGETTLSFSKDRKSVV